MAAIAIEKLSKSYGRIQALASVTFRIEPGEVIGLLGPNGAGKTTLMKSVMGLLKASSGRAEFNDVDLLKIPTHDRARMGIGYMPEDRRLIPDLTVEENVLVPAWAAGVADPAARLAKIYEYVPEVKELAPRKGSQLSGGQQKLAALARALMCGTRLLLLDEPFEGVAPALAQRLAEVVASLKREGMSVMVSESDLQHSERLVDRVVTIDRGAIS